MQSKHLSIFLLISIKTILARSPGSHLTINTNKTKVEETAKVKHKTKLRRRNKQCDYLYEDCESEIDALKEASFEKNYEDNNKRYYEDFLDKEQVEYINKESNKHKEKLHLPTKLAKSLEDFSYLEDTSTNTTTPDYKNEPISAKPLDNKQEVAATKSTAKIFLSSLTPDVEPTLPVEIGLCNNYAKCRIFPGYSTPYVKT